MEAKYDNRILPLCSQSVKLYLFEVGSGSDHPAARVRIPSKNIYTLAICKMAISTPVFVIGL